MESYTGVVQTSYDAIILLEAARTGLVPKVSRRLKDKERKMIKAGDIFIWDEKEAKMRRWTDGRSWSASRVTGSFLTYREMEYHFGTEPTNGEEKFNLSNFRYKRDGLIKQSFSITTTKGEKLHLISYTTANDYTNSKLLDRTPSKDPAFANIVVSTDLYPVSSQTRELIKSNSTNQAKSPSSPASTQSIASSTPVPLQPQSPISSVPSSRANSIKANETSFTDSTPRGLPNSRSPKLRSLESSPIWTQSSLPPLYASTFDSRAFQMNHRSSSISNYDATTLNALDKMTFKL